MLTTADVAHHFALSEGTIRKKIRDEDLIATRVHRDYRITWNSVWACEQGPSPKRGTIDRYKEPLLSKRHLALATCFDIRTVERWIEDGLPTRSVFGSVRINPSDARDWLKHARGFDVVDLARPEE